MSKESDQLLNFIYGRSQKAISDFYNGVPTTETVAEDIETVYEDKRCKKTENCVYPDLHSGECRVGSRGW